jgi:hypothetical protein
MSPTARRPATVRGRILAVAGAVAALAGAGTAAASAASAAVVPSPVTAAEQSPAVLTGTSAPAVLTGLTGNGTAALALNAPPAPHAAPAHTQAPVAHTTPAPAGVTTPAPAPAAHTVTAPAAPAAHATVAVHTSGPAAPAAHAAPATHAAPAAPAVNHTQPRRYEGHADHGPARPYEMYDSVTPSAIPGGKAVATYADGPYAASPSEVAGRSSVIWIDTNGSDPRGANALDVEPGDATPQMAASWAAQRMDDHPHGIAVIYTMRSDWAATQAAISGLPQWQQHGVRYWIADPTGVRHLVPGSSATQWYWGTNYDISTVAPGF